MRQYYVYIMANRRNGTIYTGVTNSLYRRVWEHKNGLVEGFTKRYHIHMLVYYEKFGGVNKAIHREKCIKKWERQWKINLIEKMNPDWNDLYENIK